VPFLPKTSSFDRFDQNRQFGTVRDQGSQRLKSHIPDKTVLLGEKRAEMTPSVPEERIPGMSETPVKPGGSGE